MELHGLVNGISLAVLLAAAWGLGGRLAVTCGDAPTAGLRHVLTRLLWVFAVVIGVTHLLAAGALLTGAPLVRPCWIASVVLGLAVWALRSRPPVPALGTRHLVHAIRAHRGVMLCALIVVGAYGVLLCAAALRPPAGYDGLYYHLPLILRWLADGGLPLYPEALEFCYPSNCEVWQMPFLATGSEALLNLSLVPAGVVLALAIAGVSRQLGATVHAAVAAALIVLVCPMVAFQTFGTYVDMFGTGFTVAALYYAGDTFSPGLSMRRLRADALCCGLATGIAVGAKLSFAPWAATAVAAGAVGAWRVGRRTGQGGAVVLGAAGRALAGGLGCLGFWLVRSTWHSGSPLFPFQFEIAGVTLGAGRGWADIQSAIQRSYAGVTALAYPWVEWQDTGIRYAQHYGLGPAVATFGLAALAYLLWRGRHRWTTPGGARRLTLLAMTAVGLTTFIVVLGSDPRYALPAWIVLMPAVGPIVDLGERYARRMTWTVTTAAVLLSTAMIVLWPAKDLLGDLRDGGWTRARAYQIPELIDDLPAGTVVANLDVKSMNYPLCGRHLHNRVIEQLLVRAAGTDNLAAPLSAKQIADHAIDVVYTRGSDPPPFEGEVAYTLVFDDTDDPGRLATTRPTRLYWVGSSPVPPRTAR